ncbi:MAG: DEAD/DEAH box helicase [candidate division KSB1 bacterium]|nr:DEAD/DEAH box helicase [candidate division KSB1 bacterium]
MDVFGFRHDLITDYKEYVNSFLQIQDTQINEYVSRKLQQGSLWPEPLIQLNPSFESGEWVDELVDQNVLHPECRRIFRKKSDAQDKGKPLHLHLHQAQAIKTAQSNDSYVLTTGTGSGKSLAYIIPIVDSIVRQGSGKGIKAIIVYPMNALANSQFGELEKFIQWGYSKNNYPVKFAKYTGQESDETRREIIKNPPDILLTNYVMLELILTRLDERKLIEAASGLNYLVLDTGCTHIADGKVRMFRFWCGGFERLLQLITYSV